MKIVIEGTEEEIRRILERIGGEPKLTPVPEQPIRIAPRRERTRLPTAPWIQPWGPVEPTTDVPRPMRIWWGTNAVGWA